MLQLELLGGDAPLATGAANLQPRVDTNAVERILRSLRQLESPGMGRQVGDLVDLDRKSVV